MNQYKDPIKQPVFHGSTWNPKANQFKMDGCLMEMVISNHFLCKDLVHHPIDSQPFINGWPWGPGI